MTSRTSDLYLHTLENPAFHVRIEDILTEECSMRLLELKGFYSAPDIQQLRWRQRYNVRD